MDARQHGQKDRLTCVLEQAMAEEEEIKRHNGEQLVALSSVEI